MKCFTTLNDLRNWVYSHAGDNLSNAEMEEIAQYIRTDADFPHWGEDCTAYLESLPQLCELLDELNP